MSESTNNQRVPCLLWPFWAIWRLVVFIVGITGRLLAIILGFVFIIIGVLLSITVVGLDHWNTHDLAWSADRDPWIILTRRGAFNLCSR